MRIDLNDLSMAEIEQAEKLAEVRSIASELANGASAKTIIALACVWQQRDDPAFDMSQARNLKMRDIDLVTEPDPHEQDQPSD